MCLFGIQTVHSADNWYLCSLDQEASGSLETLYLPTPKTYDDAFAECVWRGGILANIQNKYHGECARDLLGPRNGQCNSSSSDNCKTSSYFCKTNTCNVWVALQRPSQSKTWTWMLPVLIAANNVSWITAPLQGAGGRNECGYYSPEKESFGIESCSMKLSFYCQRYTPNGRDLIEIILDIHQATPILTKWPCCTRLHMQQRG